MPDPIRHPINSSSLAFVSYNPNGSVLSVWFRDRQGQPVQGQYYEYEGVPEWVYQDLIDPEMPGSKGQFFSRVVKGGGFVYRKVERELPSG